MTRLRSIDQYAIERMAKQHYHSCDPDLRVAGMGWYDQAQRDTRELSRILPRGSGVSAAAGVLAALSPQTQWSKNWEWAQIVCAAAGLGRPSHPTIGGFPKNRVKAWRIANGESPGRVLNGPKVVPFWRALKGDGDAVALDLWMFRAFGLPDSPPKSIYPLVAEPVLVAAHDLGIKAAQLQAIIWLHVRGVRPSDPKEYFA